MKYVIAYDVGTTGVKTCLVSVGEKLRITGDAYGEYDLFVMEDGGAEQDADQWWQAMCDTTRELVSRTEISPDDIDGISFCSQMQGLVLVDREGSALRRPMSYLDQRAVKEMKECQGHCLQISGVNAGMLLRSLAVTHAASTSV